MAFFRVYFWNEKKKKVRVKTWDDSIKTEREKEQRIKKSKNIVREDIQIIIVYVSLVRQALSTYAVSKSSVQWWRSLCFYPAVTCQYEM